MGEDVKGAGANPAAGDDRVEVREPIVIKEDRDFWADWMADSCLGPDHAMIQQIRDGLEDAHGPILLARYRHRLAQPQSGDVGVMRKAAESLLAWCSHVEKFGYERMNEGPDASPHFLAGEARAFVEFALATPTPDAARRAALEEALRKCVKFIAMFKDNGAANIAEGVHAGLRKGSAAYDSGQLWSAIANSRTTAWSDAAAWAHDPFFSLWGGDDALQSAKDALAAGDAA